MQTKTDSVVDHTEGWLPKGFAAKILRVQGTDLGTAVDAFLRYCRAKNLSENTIVYYTLRLASFRRFADSHGACLESVDREIVRDFLVEERERNSARTANHSLLALRVFGGFLANEGFVDQNPFLGLDRLKSRKTLIQTLSKDQIEALLATCSKTYCGIRDRTIILCLLDTGLRVSELVNLSFQDIDLVDRTLLVVGKGDRERRVPFASAVKQALNVYLLRRGELPEQDRVFVTQYGEPMTRLCCLQMFQRRAKEAGISGVRVSPHTFRHTFAKQWLLNGGDVFSLQKILGHSSMDMVRQYVNLAQAEVQTVHARFSPADSMFGGQITGQKKRLK